ncbi:MAG: sugar phosphate nucleotidyltransferase [Armatimonadota bacterium]
MKAVVMAGGEGSRLRPLTSNRPKPLVPVANIPVMEYIINLLRENGIIEIVVTLHYLADEIITYFGDGSSFGVQIVYSIEDEPLGTAGSVKKVEKYFDDTFLVISADALTDIKLEEVIKFHREKKSIATIALQRVSNPVEFGIVITSEEGKIEKFVEKPSWGEVFSDTINTGIYILEPEIFDYMERNKYYDFSQNVFPTILEDNKCVYGCVVDGYWCDIGNIQQYVRANEDMLKDKIKAEIAGSKHKEKIWTGEGTQIHPSANIKGPAVIGSDCVIGPDVFIGEDVVIGNNCIIEESAHLDRVIIWNNVYIGKKSRLNKCIICQGNVIKPSVSVGEGAVIGDKCFIGEGSAISPQVKIWPGKHVEPGASVSMSIVWGSKWPGTLFSTNGVQGLANIELTPEFAMKLGSAFAAYLEKGALVTTSRDDHKASRMLNRSIICGLISVGVNVADLRVMPAPISRYIVGSGEAKGGVHVKISSDNPQTFIIQFFDETGINVDRGKERKIENAFFREDFPLTSVDEIGRIDFPSRIVDRYIQAYMKLLNIESISEKKFKIVIDHAYGNSSTILPLLLGRLGCETITLNSYLDIEKGMEVQAEKGKYLGQLSNIVKTLNADMGIWIGWNAEKIVLVDEKGTIIQNENLLALMSKLIIESASPEVIAVPINSPSIIDKMAKEKNCKVIRTKTDERSLMNVASIGKDKIYFAGDIYGGFIFPNFHPSFDAIFSFAKILELMAGVPDGISGIYEKIPHFDLVYKTAECVQQFKGKVMRQLVEISKNKDIELLEGIKIYFPDGWINIIPDPAEPVLHLYAEGATSELAQSYIEEYENKIHDIKGSSGITSHKIKERFIPASTTEVKIPENVTDKMYALNLPLEKAFYFCLNSGYLGIKARNMDEFFNVLKYIDIESIEYHLHKKDFEKWFQYELTLKDIAKAFEKARIKNLHGEELREEILRIFYAYKEEIIK